MASANADASASAAAFCCSVDQSSKITPLAPRANSVHAVSLTVSAAVVAVTGTMPRSEDRTDEARRRGSEAAGRSTRVNAVVCRVASAGAADDVEPRAANGVEIDGPAAGVGIRGVADADGHEVELLRRRLRDRRPARAPGAQGRQVSSSHRRPDAAIARVQRLIDRIRDQAQRDERQHPAAPAPASSSIDPRTPAASPGSCRSAARTSRMPSATMMTARAATPNRLMRFSSRRRAGIERAEIAFVVFLLADRLDDFRHAVAGGDQADQPDQPDTERPGHHRRRPHPDLGVAAARGAQAARQAERLDAERRRRSAPGTRRRCG